MHRQNSVSAVATEKMLGTWKLAKNNQGQKGNPLVLEEPSPTLRSEWLHWLKADDGNVQQTVCTLTRQRRWMTHEHTRSFSVAPRGAPQQRVCDHFKLTSCRVKTWTVSSSSIRGHLWVICILTFRRNCQGTLEFKAFFLVFCSMY